MPPTPPRIRNIISIMLFASVFLLAVPIIGLLPYFVYLGVFHTDHLLQGIADSYHSYLSNRATLISEGAMIALGAWSCITIYRGQRREWQAYQQRKFEGESATTVQFDNPVELSPPGELSLPQVVIESRKSLRTRFVQEAFLAWVMFFVYIMWSMYYFRWPPNEHFNYSILGTIGFVFLVGTFAIWRRKSERIVADGVGISIHKRNCERMIFWSDIKQLLLDPITVLHNQPILAENYHIITTEQPLDLSMPTGTIRLTGALTPLQDKQDSTRSLITLAMHRTGLPLLTDRDAWQEHNFLIAKRDNKSYQTQMHIVLLVVAIILLGIAGVVGFALYPHHTYRTVTGQLVHYAMDSEQNDAIIQISGNPTSYSLTISDAFPYPPDSLPNSSQVTMQVNGTNIGSLDVATPTAQWHIVTQSYAEPWFAWLEFIAFVSMFAIPAGFCFIAVVGYFSQQRRQSGGVLESPGDSVVKPQLPETAKTKRELRRYTRQQGRWWGTEPKEVRDVGLAMLTLGISCILFAMLFAFLLAQSGILASVTTAGAFGMTGLLFLIISVQVIKRWRVLRQINAQESTEITGTILNWSGYMSLLSNGFDTIVQLQTDDGQEYIFRIPQKYMFIARHIGGRLRITFNLETRYVSKVALESDNSA